MSDYGVTQTDTEDWCAHCGRRYAAFEGRVLCDGVLVGHYLAGMHQCGEHPRGVVMTVSIGDPLGIADESAVWSELASPAADHYDFRVLDGVWPWRWHEAPSRILSRAEVREVAPMLGLFEITGNLLELVLHLKHFLDGRGEGWLADADPLGDTHDTAPH